MVSALKLEMHCLTMPNSCRRELLLQKRITPGPRINQTGNLVKNLGRLKIRNGGFVESRKSGELIKNQTGSYGDEDESSRSARAQHCVTTREDW